MIDHQLALRSQEWLPPHPLPCALGKGGGPLQEQKPLGRDRGWTPGLPLPSPWQLPLGQQPSLNIQPKSNFNELWKPSPGNAHRRRLVRLAAKRLRA